MTAPTSGRQVLAGLAGPVLLVAGLTVAARVAGFGRTLAFSGSVGAGCTGSVYAAANQLPNVLFEVVAGGALAVVVVPVLSGYLAQGRRADADRTASALLTWALAVLLPLSVLLAAAAGPVMRLLLGGAGAGGDGVAGCPSAAETGARMLVVFAPQVALYGVGVVLAGVLHAHGRFTGPALAPLASSLVVVAAYLAFGRLADPVAGQAPDRAAELVLTVGTTLGVAVLTLPLLVLVHRTGTRLRPTLRFPAGAAGRVRSMAAAGVAALLAQQGAVLVTLALATRAGGTGVLNTVQYAQAVYLLPYAVLAVPVSTVAFPRLAEQAATLRGQEYARTVAASTRVVLLAGLLGAAALGAAAPAVQALFTTLDAVGGRPLESLGEALTALAVGLAGWGLVTHCGRALFASGHGRAAAGATAAGWLAVVAASLAAVAGLRAADVDPQRAAVLGLAWGNTAGMCVAAALLLAAVHRAAGRAALSGLPRALVAGSLAAVGSGVVGRVVADGVLGAGPALASPGPGRVLVAGAVAAGGAAAAFVALAALLDRGDLAALAALARRRPAS